MMKIEQVIDNLNMKSFEMLGNAIEEGQHIQPKKQLVRTLYGESDWITTIRTKNWSKISKMYNSTSFSLVVRVVTHMVKKTKPYIDMQK